MAEKKSGVDSLIDALRASGASVDKDFGSNSNTNENSKTQSTTSNNAGQPGSFGDIPKAILDLPIVERAKNMKKKW